MTSILQEQVSIPQTKDIVPANDGNGIVISGMAGLYPEARYIKDLENILYNKINPISSDKLRWTSTHPEVTQFTGSVPDLDRFDAQFFKVHFRLGNNMDAMSRKILEQTYEAIYDAGISPEHLSGKKVGVYIGTCFSETEKACFYESTSKNGFGIAGCNKSMFANRISYWLNAKGPSMSIDAVCCSSTVALEQAFQAISHGECESAIVGGGNLCLHPQSSVHYGRIMNISKDGKTKSFAQDAAGCAKSEAINVLFLQKAKDAKRIYAEIKHVKCEFLSILNEETGPKYGFYRNPVDVAGFLSKFYVDADVAPNDVEYVEAFGSAVPDVDKSELAAIHKVFCKDKQEPLLVGSVMSNIGYGEAASGISAVTKVLLGYHKGELAGNLNCETPRKDIVALQEGRMQIVTDNQHFRRTYAAVNSMSVTGINGHILLYGRYKPKDLDRYKTNMPRLVTISGRQESSVKKIFEHLKSKPIDAEELALLHIIHETNISGHLGKGFIVLDTNHSNQKTASLTEKVDYFDGAQRPLWFVYSGMGSQWAGMGAQLMKIPIFSAAIERCHKVLQPKGIDIVHIITSSDKTIFDNILNSFVAIAAVQIGLTDILLEMGLVPDKIIGHSVGELGCAYADGCLTAEEMILSAYSRGLVSLETPFIRGSMAAVGIGYQQMLNMCPVDIDIACHNSSESCTISGPADAMCSFVADLTAKSIFAKEVPCSNIAYHSRYIADAGPALLKYLKKVIPLPRARSERWVSTSVPQGRWDEPSAKYSSAEYHTNNLLSPVLFEETSKLIPRNAVLVEVAPHGLLQAILKRSLPDSCTNIPLTRRGQRNDVVFVLEAIGKLYMEGFNPKVRMLYPEVEFPVSTGTPFLSHYVDWSHQDKWSLPLYQSAHRTVTASCTFSVTIHDDEFNYLKSHVIRNTTLVPFSFALVAAWDTLAMSQNVPKKTFSVEFRDVQLYVQPTLHDQKVVKLSVSLHRGNGRFEILVGNSKVATGFIDHLEPPRKDKELLEQCETFIKKYELSAQEVYQLFYERDYMYSGEFRSIHSANESLSEANIMWKDNWVTFLDGVLQLNTLKYTNGTISQPDKIRYIMIDVEKHFRSIKFSTDTENNTFSILEAQLCAVQDRTSCGGVTMNNVSFHTIKRNKNRVTLHSLKFLPRFHSNIEISTALRVFVQITAENISKNHITVIALDDSKNNSPLFNEMESISAKDELPGIKIIYRHLFKLNDLIEKNNVFENADIALVTNLSKNKKICQHLHNVLKSGTFILNEEDVTVDTARIFPSNLYCTVSVLRNAKTQLGLAYCKLTPVAATTSTFTVKSESDLPLLAHTRNSLDSQSRLIIMSSYPPVVGLTNLVKQWRKDLTCNYISLIMINERSEDILSSDEQPDINLAFNIFNNGTWGGEYYLPLEECPTSQNKITLQSDMVGNINSLHWVQAQKSAYTGTLVTVHYAGVNLGDVKRALGVVSNGRDECPSNNNYGMEFSGVSDRGENVMGLVRNGATSSHVIAQPEMLWPVPAYWSLEEAATVPFAYVYAYYCLAIKTAVNFSTNEITQYTVLVHGGAGALGQAVISICLALGHRVFTTVSDTKKKRFLIQLFPELHEKYIGNSRDSSFRDLVLSATNGRGCNVVICCLKEEFKNISFKCCGSSSTLLDTAQILNHENYMLGMYNLTNEKSYVAVGITNILNNFKSEEFQKIHGLVSDGIALGHVRPLTRVTYAPHEVVRAFRLIAASRHRGRVLLKMLDSSTKAIPRLSFEASHCHAIVCDNFNALGLQLADKLIDCGAKKLHLHFNTSLIHLNHKIRIWKKLKIEVTVTIGVLTNIHDVSNMLKRLGKLGPVEGLHVIETSFLEETVIKNIDLASRMVCPSLQYFLIMSNKHTCGYFTAVQRVTAGLPVTFLDLSLLETHLDMDGVTWYRGATDSVERALINAESFLIAQPKQPPCTSLVQQIAALTELIIPDDTPKKYSMKDLGMSSEKASSICALLRDVYNMYLEAEDIISLSYENVMKLEQNTKNSELEEIKGLGMFYSNVDPDELLATTDMVLLPTLASSSIMRDDEFDVNETYLYIVPGLEGLYARFRTLCECLKIPAFVLQPGLDRPEETPYEIAVRYSKVLLKKTGPKKTFYILGYETGVEVALKLAAILEDRGNIFWNALQSQLPSQMGTVFCLGDGPVEIKALLLSECSVFETEEALQMAVAHHMFKLMAQSSATLTENALVGCSSWRSRVDACVRALFGQVSHCAQYTRELIEAAYARINTVRHYTSAPRVLRSRLVLLRARCDTRSDEQCSLQHYSHESISVHQLSTPMAHAATDLRVPAIINRYLEAELLQAFEKRNRCDTYLMNANAFLTLTENN